MKKLLSLLLAAVLILASLAGCSSGSKNKSEDKDKGAVIQTYLSTTPVSIDPSVVYTSQDAVKTMGLIYEGLTTINENGKLEKALAKDWEYKVDERDGYLKLEITLRSSRWSDGIIVDADDFIFAWQRILMPESQNENASLLYPILNAKKVKEGLISVNDLGVSAVKDNVLEITFEKDFTDVEYFLRRLASPALVPLREDIVTRNAYWSVSGATSYVTNGPFKIKSWNDSEFTLERSVYYRCVSDSDSAKDDKVVKPYQIVNLYSQGKTPDAQYERFQNTELFYLSLNGASQELINKVGKKAEASELLSTYCLFFNTNNELFKDARVRKALSLAIDRSKLVNIVGTGVEPATGLIPYGIEDETSKKDFRKVGGELISKSANMDEAKALLKEAGVTGGAFTVECSSARDFEKTLIYYAVSAWKELGFTVTVNAPKQNYLFNKANRLYDFEQNDADVLAFDLQSMTSDAYSMLMSFSAEFGGNYIDVTTGPTEDDVVYNSHLTGFNDAEYDKLCEKIYSAANVKDRTAAMHEAESYLLEQMPVIPLFFNRDVYISQKLSNIESDKFGRLNLTELKQKSYKKYLPAEE